MSKDHFVSVTFLNNFTDDAQVNINPRYKNIFCLAKQKQQFNNKPSALGNVAYRRNLDGTGNFKAELERYESVWTVLYNKLISNKFSAREYEDVLTYLLLMSLNNPTKQKERLDIMLGHATPDEIAHVEHLETKDKHMQVRDILVGSGYVAVVKKELLQLAYWVVKNDSSVPFVTSDNPWVLLSECHFIPISKNYALQISTKDLDIAGSSKLYLTSSEAEVREVNHLMRENADLFVYASSTNVF